MPIKHILGKSAPMSGEPVRCVDRSTGSIGLVFAWRPVAAAVASAATLVGCGGSDDDDTIPAPQLATVSTRAEIVSGGDVVLQVTPGSGTSASQVSVTLNGQPVTSAL